MVSVSRSTKQSIVDKRNLLWFRRCSCYLSISSFLALSLLLSISLCISLLNRHTGTKDEQYPAQLLNTENEKRPSSSVQSSSSSTAKIAHVVSLITCKKSKRVKGFLDALMILRHSIHQNSIHALPPADSIRETGKRQGNHDDNFVIPSKYSYQMVAIVHESGGCDIHVPLLERLGYRTMIRPSPINVSAITTNDWYRDNVRHENCCGDAEFIKLYAYQLVEYPIVVHWDLDVLVLTPMDDLFDAMLKDAHSPEGRLARQQLQLQPPQGRQQLPDRIDAFFTRDVTSAKPWEKVRAIQGGFVVVRPNASHFSLYQKFITEANYSRGRGPDSGWGGMGYGGFQGAMAYQGVISFFYDQIYPGHAVELDVCRWNQVTADVIWRGPDSPEMMGQCRQYPVNGNFTSNTPELGQCEDCRVVPVEETRTVHYTACNKPWDCRLPHPRVFRDTAQTYRLKELTNITTCGLLFRKYFNVRNDLEIRISSSMNLVPIVPRGDLHPEYFRGYCKSGKYIALQETLPVDFHMQRIYGF